MGLRYLDEAQVQRLHEASLERFKEWATGF